MKTTALLLFTLLFSLTSFRFSAGVNDAADTDSYLENTRAAIYGAKKWQKKGNHPLSEDLSLAINLQSKAEQLFTATNYAKAVACSYQSRLLAIKTLKGYTSESYVAPYYSWENEKTEFIQLTLNQNQTTLEFWINEL